MKPFAIVVHVDIGRCGLPHTDFVPDALEQALHDRQPQRDGGVQYVSIRYTEGLAEAGVKASVGSVGDSYDNALAETIDGLYEAELIYKQSWNMLDHSNVYSWKALFHAFNLFGDVGRPMEAG